jgi:hypothetical protein
LMLVAMLFAPAVDSSRFQRMAHRQVPLPQRASSRIGNLWFKPGRFTVR